jgi:signal transduction histidine kinase
MSRRLHMAFQRNLRHRITLFATALAVSVLVIVGAATLAVTSSMVNRAVHSALANRSQLVAQQLALSLNAVEADLRDLAANSFIANGLVDSTGRDIYLLPFLRDHRIPFSSRVDLLVADYQGKPFASNTGSIPALGILPEMQETIESAQPTAFLAPESPVLSLYFLVPIIFPPTGHVEGILIARLDLNEIFQNTVRDLIGDEYAAELRQGGSTQISVPATTSPWGVIEAVHPLRLGGSLSPLPLEIVVAQDRAAAFTSIGQLIAAWLLLSLVMLGLVILGARRMAWSLTRPLQTLTDVAYRLAAGDYGRRVRVEGHDEVAALGRALNEMAEEISVAHAELEQRVRERTRQLEMSQHALVDAKEVAEAANRAKSEFLANISHELRTPIHGILSFAAFGLKRATTAPPAKIHNYFQQIDQSGRVLLLLLNDLLDLAKWEAGRMTCEYRRVDLRVLLATAADEFRSLAAEQRLTIDFSLPDAPLEVLIDSHKIMQVLRNLLSNAVKFTPDGGSIELNLHRTMPSVVVSVSDRGVGIPPGELLSIFDQFVQSSQTKTGAGGTGLGLAICREIVTAHQGRIWAEHWPGGGAAFFFTLPLPAPEEASLIPTAEPAGSPQPRDDHISPCRALAKPCVSV